MENEPVFNQEGKEKIVDGILYRKVNTGYTLRQYFSHSTPEMGPGPGWDARQKILEQYGVDDPSALPDEPYYIWEEIDDKK
jgi:hypothetical protein